MDWKQLKRHPLSAEYEDITGVDWMRFCQSFKRHGFLPERQIVLHQGMVLDGWQRLRACLETATDPDFTTLPEGRDADEFVEAMNDDRRKTESAQAIQKRAYARRMRVAERRQKVESLRTIAEEEGVSKATVERDLEVASTVPGGTVEPVGGKVLGADNKLRDAPPPKPKREKKEKVPVPRCDRCKRLYPNKETSRPGCVACFELRRASKKPGDAPDIQETNEVPPEVVDDAKRPVPENIKQVFRAVALFNKLEKLLLNASKAAKEIENLACLKKKKPLKGEKHYGEMWGPMKNARKRVIAMRPSMVCDCEGKGCAACGQTGYLTVEEWDAKSKKEIPS
jgi:hypothetical protein